MVESFSSTLAGIPRGFPKSCLDADANADADIDISKWPLIKQVMMTISDNRILDNRMECFSTKRIHESKIMMKIE